MFACSSRQRRPAWSPSVCLGRMARSTTGGCCYRDGGKDRLNAPAPHQINSRDQSDHRRIAASIPSQVNDHSIRIGEEAHRRDYGFGSKSGGHKAPQIKVSNVTLQALNFFESEVHGSHELDLASRFVCVWLPISRILRRESFSAINHSQMFIMAHLLQVFLQGGREHLRASDLIVFFSSHSFTNGLLHLFRCFWEHIRIVESF